MPKNTIQADALLILWAKATALCLTLLTIACLCLDSIWMDHPTGPYWTLMVLIGPQWAFAFEDALAD